MTDAEVSLTIKKLEIAWEMTERFILGGRQSFTADEIDGHIGVFTAAYAGISKAVTDNIALPRS